MRSFKLLTMIFAALFAFSILSCGDKTESDKPETEVKGHEESAEEESTENLSQKEKVIKFAEETLRFFGTEEGRVMLEKRGMEFQKKLNAIARDAGFEGLEEATGAMGEQAQTDAEIKELSKKMNDLFNQ